MTPQLTLPGLSALACAVALTVIASVAFAAEESAQAESSSAKNIRPALGSPPQFFKRPDLAKEAAKSAVTTEAQGVSMTELADLIDKKIAEVTAKRAAAPVVKVRSQASPRVSRPAPKVVAAATVAAGVAVVPAADPEKDHLLAGREVAWAYAGATGPEFWGQLKPAYRQCMLGKRQSPIDIRDSFKVQLDPIRFDYRPTNFRVIDNGHTVQVNLDMGNSITVMGQRYELIHFHFHRPSEERINGQAYPMSAHLVHKSPTGQYAVVAVLLDQGEPHPLIQQIWNNLPLEKNQEQMAQLPMDPAQILPGQTGQYYTYMGSLTTPPCTENVLWMVMKQPVTVSMAQIEIFHRLYPMNARPVQPTSGRLIKEGL